ncbi:VIER F-box protein 2 [Tanacetum coccineum]
MAGDAWRWFDGIKGSITSWVDFCAKFFGKYYPPSRTGKVETLIIKWDPTNPKFENWLASKFVYYQNYGYIYTKGALWEYWKLGSDEIKPTNEETADLEETNHDNEQEIGEIFRIETKLFDYETPLCEKFKKIEGFKTYEEYKDDWIYEWNENVPWVHEITIDCGKKKTIYFEVWTEPDLVVHYCKPFNYKSGYSEWPTCSWKEDGYCNRGNLPGAYIVGNTLRYQDLEWYDALKDSELKDEALRNKAIMEGLIDEDDESSNNGWRRWEGYEIDDHDQEEREYENGHEDKERCELFDDHELPVCNIRRFKMIKYAFGDDEEYVAVKEDEYDDLTSTRKDACRAYQEIFRMMDERWMKRQPTLSRSCAEAEYRGVANVASDSCWIRNLLLELHCPIPKATIVFCDNVSAIFLCGNPVQHQRTNHIEIDIHFVREKVARGEVRDLHVPSRYQIADIFTKGLPRVLFDDFRDSLSVRPPPAAIVGVY